MSPNNNFRPVDHNPRLTPGVIASFETPESAMQWIESVRENMQQLCNSCTPPPDMARIQELWREGQTAKGRILPMHPSVGRSQDAA
ncbi:MAG: hypothetical protein PHW10_01700 [Candidatus Peribacteraceae bacterium]|nr:hypothetical protein [Candidatus Peribacteraceae bacterium]